MRKYYASYAKVSIRGKLTVCKRLLVGFAPCTIMRVSVTGPHHTSKTFNIKVPHAMFSDKQYEAIQAHYRPWVKLTAEINSEGATYSKEQITLTLKTFRLLKTKDERALRPCKTHRRKPALRAQAFTQQLLSSPEKEENPSLSSPPEKDFIKEQTEKLNELVSVRYLDSDTESKPDK